MRQFTSPRQPQSQPTGLGRSCPKCRVSIQSLNCPRCGGLTVMAPRLPPPVRHHAEDVLVEHKLSRDASTRYRMRTRVQKAEDDGQGFGKD